MKPLYFPFTYVAEPLADALGACFRQFAVYRPSEKPLPPHMLKWVQRGILEVRVPVRHDSQVIEGVMRDYRAWAELHHRGSGMRSLFLNYLEDAVPFHSDTSPSRIISEIKGGSRNPNQATAPDPILQAVVFLEFAQEFDRQAEEISRGMNAADMTTRELILNLLGEGTDAEPLSGECRLPDSIEYMALERLRAWTQLLGGDRKAPELLITSSPSLLDRMLDQMPAAEQVFQNDSIPIEMVGAEAARPWQDELAGRLTDLLDLDGDKAADFSGTISIDPAPGPRVSLRIYRIAGQAPLEVLIACNRAPGVQPADMCGAAATPRNTLLGCIAQRP
jgi:hypothetical protein